jgi:hypothetical protein
MNRFRRDSQGRGKKTNDGKPPPSFKINKGNYEDDDGNVDSSDDDNNRKLIP